jgi:hypothetical protein
MAVYDFSFDSKYAGHTATLIDASTGTEDAQSPLTLDANGDARVSGLSYGPYRAQVDNADGAFGDGYSVVDGVYNVEASIEGAGGGGMSANSIENWIEIPSPQAPDGANHTIDWTGADKSDSVTISDDPHSFVLAESGVYGLNAYITFADPAQDTGVAIFGVVGRLAGGGHLSSGAGAQTIFVTGVARISTDPQGPADNANLHLQVRFKSAAGSPVWPTITDAYVECDKLIDG